MAKKLRAALAVSILLGSINAAACWAQDAASPKFTMFGGAGVADAQGHARGAMQFGASLDEAPPGIWGGFLFEGGYIGPWANPKAGSAIFSANYMAAWAARKKWKAVPFATVGYSRLFGTGNAVNFGGGVDYHIRKTQAVRVEVRDYLAFTTPIQHNVALRLGWVTYLPD